MPLAPLGARAGFAMLVAYLSIVGAAFAGEAFDLVLKGGRVIDPETGLDAVRDVGIRGDTIASVSVEPLTGRKVVDARGLIVAPGFIELHQHGFDPRSIPLLALDGVTTALEFEVGVTDVERFRQALALESPQMAVCRSVYRLFNADVGR